MISSKKIDDLSYYQLFFDNFDDILHIYELLCLIFGTDKAINIMNVSPDPKLMWTTNTVIKRGYWWIALDMHEEIKKTATILGIQWEDV